VSYAGLLAGTLDITAAFVVYGLRGATPLRILQSIAAGLMGASAFKGGLRTAALGLLLHFLIAFVAAAVYYAASRRLEVLLRRPVLSGLLYGVAVYVVMNHVVVPLSAIGRRPFVPALAVIIVVVHMVCVGLPIALVVSRRRVTERPLSRTQPH
jgi:hypothetical protein